MTLDDATTMGGIGEPTQQPCLLLLFPDRQRPTASEIRSALGRTGVGRVSHDPGTTVDETGHARVAGDWLELLTSGLTFDLLGLAPGEPLSLPPLRHRFGLVDFDPQAYEAIGLAPGPHLAGAASAVPVVRAMLRLGAGLSAQCGEAVAAVWLPAASVMAGPLFAHAVTRWLDGGAFPALGLTGLNVEHDGALVSDGLSFFIGKELRLDPSVCADRTAAIRLLLRLVDLLVEAGPPAGPEAVLLADGTRARLLPGDRVISVASD